MPPVFQHFLLNVADKHVSLCIIYATDVSILYSSCSKRNTILQYKLEKSEYRHCFCIPSYWVNTFFSERLSE